MSNLFLGIPSKCTTVENLLQKYGFPRDAHDSIVLCHGTFDLVHPGHLRQLSFAKTQAPILVVSLTSDRFISKSGVKPYVPQEIRSVNLSALELVDYVIISDSETPNDILKMLKPEFFVKGFDYANQNNPKTIEEKRIVEEYGGKMIFSPGDFVMSSTKLIESRDFNLNYERLRLLMEQENVNRREILECIREFSSQRVAVFGDTIVDRITSGTMIGASYKTPTLATRKVNSRDYIGGAAIVALHVAAAGASTSYVSLFGEDKQAEFVREKLGEAGVTTHIFCEDGRPTTLKESFDIDGYRVLKMDCVSNAPISPNTKQLMIESLNEVAADAYIFSDFRHGIFNSETVRFFLDNLKVEATLAADSQVASRWGNILDFRGADLITVNEKEARYSLGDQDSPIRPLGEHLFRKLEPKMLILKLGRDGAISFRRNLEGSDPRHFFVLDSFARHVSDAVGAGDALLAYSTLAWHVSRSPLISSIIGLIAAGLECERIGNIPITFSEVQERIDLIIS